MITGVEHRLRTFFDITDYDGSSFLVELNLVRDFVIGNIDLLIVFTSLNLHFSIVE